MDAATISAIIALGGVVVSSVISYWVSVRQASHRFNELLYQARIAAYPAVYGIVSALAKCIRYGELSQTKLSEAFERLDDWDSKHALLMSPMTTKAIFDLRFHLGALVSEQPDLSRPEVKKPLIQAIAALENGMKTELGVYAAEDFHNPQEIKDVSEYIPKELRTIHRQANDTRGL